MTTNQAVAIPAPEAIREAVRELRNDLGMLQEHVADAMARLGFDWKRNTVSDVELGRRRLSIEELLGLASVFKVPANSLLLRAGRHVLVTPEWSLTDGEIGALLTSGTSAGNPKAAATLLAVRDARGELDRVRTDRDHLVERGVRLEADIHRLLDELEQETGYYRMIDARMAAAAPIANDEDWWAREYVTDDVEAQILGVPTSVFNLQYETELAEELGLPVERLIVLSVRHCKGPIDRRLGEEACARLVNQLRREALKDAR